MTYDELKLIYDLQKRVTELEDWVLYAKREFGQRDKTESEIGRLCVEYKKERDALKVERTALEAKLEEESKTWRQRLERQASEFDSMVGRLTKKVEAMQRCVEVLKAWERRDCPVTWTLDRGQALLELEETQ